MVAIEDDAEDDDLLPAHPRLGIVGQRWPSRRQFGLKHRVLSSYEDDESTYLALDTESPEATNDSPISIPVTAPHYELHYQRCNVCGFSTWGAMCMTSVETEVSVGA